MDSALEKKLMLKKFNKILIQDRPDHVNEFDGLSFDIVPSGSYDLVLSFVFNLDEMEALVNKVAEGKLLNDGGYLYIAYPKKGNKKYSSYIERDSIFPRLEVNDEDGFVKGTALKFSKMVALNDIFTIVGLKYLPGGTVSKGSSISARVEDYIEKIPELREQLYHMPGILAVYDSLTPGYQRDWARYIYSSRTEATREKRLSEMKEILEAGYKSKDLYRRREK